MNKWVNPPKRVKTENETPDPPEDGFTIQPPESFGFYLKQLGKKKLSKKSKRERLLEKGLLLSNRLRNE